MDLKMYIDLGFTVIVSNWKKMKAIKELYPEAIVWTPEGDGLYASKLLIDDEAKNFAALISALKYINPDNIAYEKFTLEFINPTPLMYKDLPQAQKEFLEILDKIISIIKDLKEDICRKDFVITDCSALKNDYMNLIDSSINSQELKIKLAYCPIPKNLSPLLN